MCKYIVECEDENSISLDVIFVGDISRMELAKKPWANRYCLKIFTKEKQPKTKYFETLEDAKRYYNDVACMISEYIGMNK